MKAAISAVQNRQITIQYSFFYPFLYAKGRCPNWVTAELFNVTVSHLPQLRHNIADLGYGDLILAGHVHSMQIKMRIGKRRFSPAQWFYDEWSGLYDNDGHRLYINDGIGYVGFPMRLGAYPEVTLFVLER